MSGQRLQNSVLVIQTIEGACLPILDGEKAYGSPPCPCLPRLIQRKRRCSLKEFLDRGKLRGNHPFQTVEIHVNQPGNQIQMEVGGYIEDSERIVCGHDLLPAARSRLIAS